MGSNVKRAAINLQGWCVLAAVIIIAVLGFKLFLVGPPIKTGAALLPKPTCPGGARPTRLQTMLSSSGAGNWNILGATTGCNGVSSNLAPELDALQGVGAQLSSLHLPQPTGPVTLALGYYPSPSGVTAYAQSGRPGALALNLAGRSLASANINGIVLAGMVQLSLADTTPGLPSAIREQVAWGLVDLTSGSGAAAAVKALRRAAPSNALLGAFYAWLGARYGTSLLSDALNNCRQNCNWTKQLTGALSARHASLRQLMDQFVSRAVAAPERAAALRMLGGNAAAVAEAVTTGARPRLQPRRSPQRRPRRSHRRHQARR